MLASPYGKKLPYIFLNSSTDKWPLGQSFKKPLYHSWISASVIGEHEDTTGDKETFTQLYFIEGTASYTHCAFMPHKLPVNSVFCFRSSSTSGFNLLFCLPMVMSFFVSRDDYVCGGLSRLMRCVPQVSQRPAYVSRLSSGLSALGDAVAPDGCECRLSRCVVRSSRCLCQHSRTHATHKSRKDNTDTKEHTQDDANRRSGPSCRRQRRLEIDAKYLRNVLTEHCISHHYKRTLSFALTFSVRNICFVHVQYSIHIKHNEPPTPQSSPITHCHIAARPVQRPQRAHYVHYVHNSWSLSIKHTRKHT